jgi:hypothetical protein
MALLSKTHREQSSLDIYLRELTIRIHPTSPAIMGAAGVLQDRQLENTDGTGLQGQDHKVKSHFGYSVAVIILLV